MISKETALSVAASLHRGKTYGGQPYWHHCKEVCDHIRYDAPDFAYVAAALHDAINSGMTTYSALEYMGVDPEAMGTIKLLTRLPGEVHADYIRRIAFSGNVWAIRIKIVDLECDLRNNNSHTLRQRYEASLRLLLAARSD